MTNRAEVLAPVMTEAEADLFGQCSARLARAGGNLVLVHDDKADEWLASAFIGTNEDGYVAGHALAVSDRLEDALRKLAHEMGVPDATPADRTCPACGSQPGAKCTVPTDTSRKPVEWVHSAREEER